jgi:hypothetical protein
MERNVRAELRLEASDNPRSVAYSLSGYRKRRGRLGEWATVLAGLWRQQREENE